MRRESQESEHSCLPYQKFHVQFGKKKSPSPTDSPVKKSPTRQVSEAVRNNQNMVERADEIRAMTSK